MIYPQHKRGDPTMKNQMMKTLITIALSATLTLSPYIAPIGQISFADLSSTSSPSFTDMTTHWSKAHVSPLTEKGIISGYGDKTFKPDNTLKRIEFIVLALKALESEQVITLDTSISTGDYWGMPYMTKAYDLKLIDGDLTDAKAFEANITREEMASIIIKAYEVMGADTTLSDDLTAKTQSMIGDLMNVSLTYKSEVTKAYALNFIAGYGDRSFKPLGSATRGEASVVISKLLDDTLRTPVVEDKPIEADASWMDWVQNQSDEYKENNLVYEHLNSTFEDGVFTIMDGGKGYGDLVVSDEYTPNLTARLQSLLDYMVRQDRFTNLYVTTNPYGEEFGLAHFIFVNFSKNARSSQSYFDYCITNDAYMDTKTYEMSRTKKGSTVELIINGLYDDYTELDEEYAKKAYDDRYMKLLKESIVAFFGEEYGNDIAEYVEQTHVDYFTNTRFGYTHYDEVKSFGNIDMVVPLISKSDHHLEIFFTIH
jgi:hypothetical protein